MQQAYHAVWCLQTPSQGTVHINYLLNCSLKRTQNLRGNSKQRKVNPSGQSPIHSSSVEDRGAQEGFIELTLEEQPSSNNRCEPLGREPQDNRHPNTVCQVHDITRV